MASPYTFASFIVKSYRTIVEQIWPSECLCCSQEGAWVCSPCSQALCPVPLDRCPYCTRYSPGNLTCLTCADTCALSGATAVWLYTPQMRHLIHSLKYRGIHTFAQWAAASLAQKVKPDCHLTITSVPTTPSRLVERGYNQSELLAKQVALTLNLPYVSLLHRLQHPLSQTHLSREERKHNTWQQFQVREPHPHLLTPILIIDDVFTTGATLDNCARALKEAGYMDIYALTLAKDLLSREDEFPNGASKVLDT